MVAPLLEAVTDPVSFPVPNCAASCGEAACDSDCTVAGADCEKVALVTARQKDRTAASS